MEQSSQQQPPQPSQEALPQRDPVTRGHLHDVAPLLKEMRDRLDRIMMRGYAA